MKPTITVNEDEVTITMDSELARAIEQTAKNAGITVEEFLRTEAEEKMRELFPG